MRFTCLLFFASSVFGAANMSLPVLQWYPTLSGSGLSSAVSAAADAQGNLYVAGSTASFDLPTVNAIQNHAGASPLTAIDTVSGAARSLLVPALAAATSLAIDPHNSRNIFCISSATLLHSVDGGTTWTYVTAPFPTGAQATFIVFDPADSNTLYVAVAQQGIYKSVDGGITFQTVNNGLPAVTSTVLDQYGHSATVTAPLVTIQLWVDPKASASVFAYTVKGLFRSADAGASWTQSQIPQFAGNLSFDPFTPGVIYTQGSKSVDEGVTWTAFSAPAGAVVPDPLHQGTLYSNDPYGSYPGLFKSTDAGNTWALVASAQVSLVTPDPTQPTIYAYISSKGVVRSNDGFATYATLSSGVQFQPRQLVVSGSTLFSVTQSSTDVFVAKLDPSGNTIFSTYLGGAGEDTAQAMALGPDGSVFVTGQTTSSDFPITSGAYAPALTSAQSNFLVKLNPDGSLAWSTLFGVAGTTVYGIAVDASGNPYLTGVTSGNLPTTPGAYQPTFLNAGSCVGRIGPCFANTEAFATKFNAQGSGLVFSTYSSTGPFYGLSGGAHAIAVSSKGVYMAGGAILILLDPTGSRLVASKTLPGQLGINEIALDASSNVYTAGSTAAPALFPAIPGSFQSGPRPGPSLTDQGTPGGTDAFVVELDSGLSNIVAGTLLGGESTDIANSISIDPVSGSVIVSGYTDSSAFPTRTPFQEAFGPRNGFVAGLDPTLSQLLFSTYVGDARSFDVAAAVPDGNGNVLLVGSTQNQTASYVINDPGFSFGQSATVIANKIALPAAPTVRIDAVVNYASGLGNGVAPNETVAVHGANFGSDSQLFFNGQPIPIVSVSSSQLVAVAPANTATSGTLQVSVTSGKSTSNTLNIPFAAAAPGIFSVDRTGTGQGYILNADGTLNSPANPVAPGSAITVFVNGVGSTTNANGYAVTDQTAVVFIDYFAANGISATMQQVKGLPGSVYAISVYVPSISDVTLPPQVPVMIYIGASVSQTGLALSIQQ